MLSQSFNELFFEEVYNSDVKLDDEDYIKERMLDIWEKCYTTLLQVCDDINLQLKETIRTHKKKYVNKIIVRDNEQLD